MNALTAIIGANSDPMRREFADVERMAQRAGVRIQQGLGGGAAGVGRFGALNELFVLMREIGRGNWTRVPGSFSILLTRLGLLRYVLSPLGALVIATGGAFYYFWQHIKKVNEELDNTGNIFARGWGKMADSMQKASKDAAEAAADFHHWLVKLGEDQETLADKTEDTIKQMREEARLRRESIGSKDRRGELKSDQDQRKAELDVITRAVLQQRRIAEESISKAEAANSNALTSDSAKRRNAQLDNKSSEMENTKRDIEFFAEAQKQLMDQVDKDVAGWRVHGTKAERPGLIANVRAFESKKDREIEIAGKKYLFSLNDASALLESNRRGMAELNSAQDRLAAVQKELADIAKDSKGDAEKQKKASEKLEKEKGDLEKSIALHEKYDAKIASAGGKFSHGHINTLQAVGAFAQAGVDIQRQTLHHVAAIRQHLTRNAKAGGGVGHVQY